MDDREWQSLSGYGPRLCKIHQVSHLNFQRKIQMYYRLTVLV